MLSSELHHWDRLSAFLQLLLHVEPRYLVWQQHKQGGVLNDSPVLQLRPQALAGVDVVVCDSIDLRHTMADSAGLVESKGRLRTLSGQAVPCCQRWPQRGSAHGGPHPAAGAAHEDSQPLGAQVHIRLQLFIVLEPPPLRLGVLVQHFRQHALLRHAAAQSNRIPLRPRCDYPRFGPA